MSATIEAKTSSRLRPVRSALVVPLVSGDDLLGTLTFSSLTGERDYREDELDLAAGA